MGFNLLNAAIGAVEGFAETGNPIGAAAMGAASAFGGGGTLGNAAGATGNGALGVLNAQNEAFQVAMYAEQMHHQEQVQAQSQAFDEMMDEKSEAMREMNTRRDVQMAQRKADDMITKKFIESITQ